MLEGRVELAGMIGNIPVLKPRVSLRGCQRRHRATKFGLHRRYRLYRLVDPPYKYHP